MTSNVPEEGYQEGGMYDAMIKSYQQGLSSFLGPTEILISGNTLQVKDYSRFNWTMFDPAKKQERHDTVFPEEMKKAYDLGAALVK